MLEIHCYMNSDENKIISLVSIMFNNEELRRHKILNRLYEKFRFYCMVDKLTHSREQKNFNPTLTL